MSDTNEPTRRAALAGVGTAGLAALVGCLSVGGSSGESSGGGEYGGWLSNTNYEGSTADRTGNSEVRVTVAPNGNYVFDPPAVAVDPGTTVVWEWAAGPSRHDVVEEGGGYASELHAEEGATFSHAFEESGVSKYYCTPHRSMGMKGVVDVVEE